jgi:hypothetical protein
MDDRFSRMSYDELRLEVQQMIKDHGAYVCVWLSQRQPGGVAVAGRRAVATC